VGQPGTASGYTTRRNLIEASSTSAKAAIAAGDFELAQRYLNPRVLHHIQKRGLYQNPMPACT